MKNDIIIGALNELVMKIQFPLVYCMFDSK
jgi:hypothetical protein